MLEVQSWRMHHEFAGEPDYSEEQTFTVEDDGIFRSTRPGKSVKLPWTKISNYADSENMFLVVSPWPWGAESEPKVSWYAALRPKPVVVILPKRAFGPGEVGQFRELLDRKVSVWAKLRSRKTLTLRSQL